MIQIKGLDHVVIRARDTGALVAFYRDVLGCPVERESTPEFGLTQLRAGASLIDIVSAEGELGRMGGAAPGKDGYNMDHFCVRVDSRASRAIRRAGQRAENALRRGGQRSVDLPRGPRGQHGRA